MVDNFTATFKYEKEGRFITEHQLFFKSSMPTNYQLGESLQKLPQLVVFQTGRAGYWV